MYYYLFSCLCATAFFRLGHMGNLEFSAAKESANAFGVQFVSKDPILCSSSATLRERERKKRDLKRVNGPTFLSLAWHH